MSEQRLIDANKSAPYLSMDEYDKKYPELKKADEMVRALRSL